MAHEEWTETDFVSKSPETDIAPWLFNTNREIKEAVDQLFNSGYIETPLNYLNEVQKLEDQNAIRLVVEEFVQKLRAKKIGESSTPLLKEYAKKVSAILDRI